MLVHPGQVWVKSGLKFLVEEDGGNLESVPRRNGLVAMGGTLTELYSESQK